MNCVICNNSTLPTDSVDDGVLNWNFYETLKCNICNILVCTAMCKERYILLGRKVENNILWINTSLGDIYIYPIKRKHDICLATIPNSSLTKFMEYSEAQIKILLTFC